MNSNHNEGQQNFDCMHEMIHYFLHTDSNSFHCICADDKTIIQNSSIEWQANEGAAQALVPFQIFIPKYINLSRKSAHKNFGGDISQELAIYFGVSIGVIETRIKSLNYEIYLYLKREKLSDIKLISLTALKNQGININHQKLYCKNCLSALTDEYIFCPICGAKVIGKGTFAKCAYRNWGAGYMIYAGIDVDENSKAKVCPQCENEDISGGTYCKICGFNLVNRCTKDEGYDSCERTADGNARYCVFCGASTTFFENGTLKSWKKVKEEIKSRKSAESTGDNDFIEVSGDDETI